MEVVSVFGGKGFVGSEFVSQNRAACHVHAKTNYAPITSKILNFISTVDNYNVLTDPYLDINTNINLLIRILENARAIYGEDVEFNQMSSWFVYGDVFLPATEESECKPKGFYSITKYASEQLLRSYCETFNMKFKILRLANVLGKDDKKVSKKKNFTQYLVKMLLKDEPIDIYYGGNFFRDFIDVRDAARVIKIIMDRGLFGEIYNVGNGIPVKFIDIVNFLIDYTGSKSKITFIDNVPFHNAVQARSMYMDNKKLRRLGYEPQFTVFQSLQEIVDAYRHSES